jgi:hypothetical protein
VVERCTPSSADRFNADVQDDYSVQAAKAAHLTFRDTVQGLQGETFHFRMNREIAHK